MIKTQYVHRICPICGSDNDDQIFAESNFDEAKLNSHSFASRKYPEFMHYRLAICLECDLLYATHIPQNDWIDGAYVHAEYDSEAESYYAARTYNKHFQKILTALPDKQGVLDIGAGNGSFLEYLQEAGFTDIEGIEPSEAPIKAAKDGVRKFIKKGVYSPTVHASRPYSLITCFQTLEHMDRVREIFISVNNKLKPGGVFLVVTHDYRSYITKILGTKSPIFDIEHLQLFSEKSIQYVFNLSGFQSCQIYSMSNCYPLYYWIKLLPLGRSLKEGLISVLKKLYAGHIPITVNVGNMVAIGYK